jgi:hypothetical protein
MGQKDDYVPEDFTEALNRGVAKFGASTAYGPPIHSPTPAVRLKKAVI